MTLNNFKNNSKQVALLTDFAPAERTDPAKLLSQHQAWMTQEQTRLFGDALLNVELVLNITR